MITSQRAKVIQEWILKGLTDSACLKASSRLYQSQGATTENLTKTAISYFI